MRKLKIAFALGSCALLAACADYRNDEQTASAANQEAGRPEFGSATDIVPPQSTGITTNAMNPADMGIGGAPQRRSGNYQTQSLPEEAVDRELEKQIKVLLTTGSLGTTGILTEDQLTRIKVEVEDGVVTLRGPVSSPNEKRTIEEQVAGIEGVRSVKNELTVGSRDLDEIPLQPVVPRTPGTQ